MAGDAVIAEPSGAALPPPVGRGYLPPAAVPTVQRFKIFFIKIAAPGQKQDRAAARACRPRPVELGPVQLGPVQSGPVNPADQLAIGSSPQRFNNPVGDSPAFGDLVQSATPRLLLTDVDNSGLSRLVTFW